MTRRDLLCRASTGFGALALQSLLARDAALRRPDEGRAMLDRLPQLASNEEERTYARLLRERVERERAVEASAGGGGP